MLVELLRQQEFKLKLHIWWYLKFPRCGTNKSFCNFSNSNKWQGKKQHVVPVFWRKMALFHYVVLHSVQMARQARCAERRLDIRSEQVESNGCRLNKNKVRWRSSAGGQRSPPPAAAVGDSRCQELIRFFTYKCGLQQEPLLGWTVWIWLEAQIFVYFIEFGGFIRSKMTTGGLNESLK